MGKVIGALRLGYLWDQIKSYIASKKYAGGTADGGTANRAASIPFGKVDSTSVATAFTATVEGITELKNGTCVYLMNGKVTSAAASTSPKCFTLDINNLGAKPVYYTTAAASYATTQFGVNSTMLFVYNTTRVSSGCWDLFYGFDSNTNTLGYQLRTNSSTLPAKFKTYRYRLLFTSADHAHFVAANASTSTDADAAKTPTTEKIDPFGPIVYYGYTTAINANANFGATYLWTQYTLNIGYSFNNTGAAASLTFPAPVYVKAAPQSDGSAIIDATTPYVQTLPSTEDGKIYIFLGLAYSATGVELMTEHPVYYYKDGCIRQWTNAAETDIQDIWVEDYSKQYFTTVALESGTIDFTLFSWADTTYVESFAYSKNGGEWIETQNSDNREEDIVISVSVVEGDKIRWKGIANHIGDDGNNGGVFTSTCRFNAQGNIMSLLYGDNFQDEVTLENGYEFSYLFNDFTYGNECFIVDALNVILPAVTLTVSCYTEMFANCTNLITAPALPATTLAQGCYSSMFYGCTSLISAPLTLPAIILTHSCYAGMFQDCASLNYIKCLATNISASHCLDEWVDEVASTGTFIKADNANWSIGVNGIPEGWNVYTESEYEVVRHYELPAAVTESTVSGWGFTKNTGTYSKPSGGIPKSDLADAVQTSLGKADTALQSFTETDPTVPAWAKAANKPSYTAAEVGALPDSTTIPSASTATPEMDGTGAAGSSSTYAKGDHVHPTDTSREARVTTVSHGTNDTTFALTPNVLHTWGTINSLTLTLASGSSTYVDGYWFKFTAGSSFSALTLPTGVVWAAEPEIEAGKTYEVMIVDGLATYLTEDMESGGSSTITESTVAGWGFTKNTGNVSSTTVNTIVSLTEAEYTALTTKDSSTLYIITSS